MRTSLSFELNKLNNIQLVWCVRIYVTSAPDLCLEQTQHNKTNTKTKKAKKNKTKPKTECGKNGEWKIDRIHAPKIAN